MRGAVDVPKKVVCASVLDDGQAATFKKAVKKHYWYELFMDELPVWGFVGLPPEEAKDDEHIYIYTHKSFDINYNGDRVRIFPDCMPTQHGHNTAHKLAGCPTTTCRHSIRYFTHHVLRLYTPHHDIHIFIVPLC